MAVSFVAASAIAPVAGTSVQLTLPTLAANDIIIIGVGSKNLVVPTNEINTPSGYTELGTKVTCDAAAAANDMRSALFWKRAVSGDSGAAVDISRAGSGTELLWAAAFVYRGCATAGSPFDADPATDFDIADDGDVEFPAINPTATDVRVCYLYLLSNDTPGANMPASFTNGGFTFGRDAALTTTVGNDASIGIYSAQTAGESLLAVSATATTGTGADIGYAFALLPASGSVTVEPQVGDLVWEGHAPLVSVEFLATTMTLEIWEGTSLRARRPLEPRVQGEQHPGWLIELTDQELDELTDSTMGGCEVWLVADGGIRGIRVTYLEVSDANTTEAGGGGETFFGGAGYIRRMRVLGTAGALVRRFGVGEIEDN